MPTFKLLFRVDPPSYFGLPEDGKLVVKAGLGREIVSPVLDSKSGNLVDHGTLPEYRRDDEAVKLDLRIGGNSASVHDNFFTLSIDAPDQEQALRAGVHLFEHFLRLLMAQHGDLFRYDLLQIEAPGEEVTVRPGPRVFQMLHATMYNLDELRERLSKAATLSKLQNEILARSLVYYEHARFLFNLIGHAPPFSVHYSFMLTSAYLYLWKALTVILGDPSTDSDYQIRFRTFGLPKNFWKDEMEPLKKVRDAYDVAHYTLDSKAIAEVQNSFGKAEALSRRVIIAYADYLASQNSPSQAANG